MEEILYEVSDQGYGVITLNREHKRNAISQAMTQQLQVLLQDLLNDQPNFLVLQSAGERVFCAGGDLTELNDELDEAEAFEHLTPMRELLYQLATFPVPTICLLQGNAFGGGCELATACDIRIAKEGTKFGFVQSNLGILPGWGGGALLFKKLHPTFALQWITEGAIFSVDDLHTKGWIHRVVNEAEWGDLDSILAAYTNKSRDQLSFLKSQYLQAIDLQELKGNMMVESRQSAFLWPSEAHRKAVQQFLNKKS